MPPVRRISGYKAKREALLAAYKKERRGYDSAVSQAVDGVLRARKKSGR